VHFVGLFFLQLYIFIYRILGKHH